MNQRIYNKYQKLLRQADQKINEQYDDPRGFAIFDSLVHEVDKTSSTTKKMQLRRNTLWLVTLAI